MNGGDHAAGRLDVRRSSFCTYGHCVGVVLGGDGVSVVDTKDDAIGLRFTREEWAAFLAGAKAGEFDLDEML